MNTSLRHVALLLATLAGVTCAGPHGGAPPRAGQAPTPSRPAPRRAVLPVANAHALAPSAASVRGGAQLPGDALAAIDRCSVCHADVFEQWSASAHRFSSMDNPFYAPSFQAARQARGAAVTRWCGGCHDPALLFAGDLDGPPIDRTHERAQLGVGCVLCHSVERLHDRTGNANYVLTPDAIPMPRRVGEGAATRYEDVRPHVARLSRDVLRTSEFCGSCHKVGITEAVNEHHWLRGQNDFDNWEQSAYAGNELDRYDPGVARQSCQDCHMPLEPAPRGDAAATNGMVRSHRFLGGHTALAAFREDPDALARERAVLANVVRVDVFRAPDATGHGAAPIEEAPLRAGESAQLDVVLVNERVGHRFPGGTADVADTWVELVVTDAAGRRVAESGALPASERGAIEPDAHRLEVRPLDDQGVPALMRDPHRYRAVAYDTTLPARAARVVRYAWSVPSGARGPFTVRARLLHRRIADPYYSFACARAPADLGHACPAPPVTQVASFEAVAGRAVASAAMPARGRRFYDHGRAIGEATVQERIEQARGSLQAARALAPGDAGPVIELARLALRGGRTDETYALLDDAARLDGATAVVPYLRATAANDVWRHAEAVAPLERAHALVPGNVRAAEMLANVLGIAGRHDDALRVIAEGLAVDPERTQLHNLQALELEALGAPEQAALAREAYLRYRLIDEAPGLRSRCKRNVPGCARESEPVHVHALHAPAN